MAFAALAWCASASVPAVVMSESTEGDSQRHPLREAIKRRFVATCSGALAGGRRQQDYLVKLGMSADRVFLGYDAVDNDHFATGAVAARNDAKRLRAELALPERYFLASARFVEKKNLTAVIRAFARYRENSSSMEPWSLVLLGDGPQREELERLRHQLGMDSCIRLPGFQQYDALPKYYGLAEAFLHASTVEQWGLVVNEALASSLPVIVSRQCGCAAELLAENSNGYSFDAEDEAALAICLQRMATLGDGDRKALGRRGKELVANFGPDRFADGLSRAAESAVANKPTSHSWMDALLLRALLAHAR